MAKQDRGTQDAVAAAQALLAQHIAAHAPTPGGHTTAIPALLLFRRVSRTPCYRAAYEPSVTVFAQGRKRVNLGGAIYTASRSSFLLSSIDVPVESKIIDASEEKPMLSMMVRLDMPMVREILASEELPGTRPQPQGVGLTLGAVTADLSGACLRLVRLLDTPADAPFLGRLILRELVYRLLCSPQGQRLRAIATSGDLSHRTAKAIAWIRANYKSPLRMDALAEVACMGVSTLHHQFRALTAMSPLQYQKHLRLHAARETMLVEGLDATSAAFHVGYESVSQFSREYSRLFGQPPMRDVKAIRAVPPLQPSSR